MYISFNPNPDNKRVGDCAVRAVAKALNIPWEDAYISLVVEGFKLHDMPSSNFVWGNVLYDHGFKQRFIENACPRCVTISQFADDHPEGVYVVGAESHTAAVVNGNYFDSWDSGDERILFYWSKEE